jgi:hypothetical protein
MATKFLKETIMTKIKDLATMTCDNAFLQFPIDEERYELLDVIQMIGASDALWLLGRRSTVIDGICRRWTSPQGSPNSLRIREFLEECGGNLDRAYTAFVQRPSPDDNDRSLVADRSRRLRASVISSSGSTSTIIKEGHSALAARFWFRVYYLINKSARRKVKRSVPRTGRVST